MSDISSVLKAPQRQGWVFCIALSSLVRATGINLHLVRFLADACLDNPCERAAKELSETANQFLNELTHVLTGKLSNMVKDTGTHNCILLLFLKFEDIIKNLKQ